MPIDCPLIAIDFLLLLPLLFTKAEPAHDVAEGEEAVEEEEELEEELHNSYSTRTNTYSTRKFNIIDPNKWLI